MEASFHEERLLAALHDRLFDPDRKIPLLEPLIENAPLDKILLRLSTLKSIRFKLEKAEPRAAHPPVIDRLVLVTPESFEVNWILIINGYFLLPYRNMASPLPHPVPPFEVCYSAVLIPQGKSVLFRNEKVRIV